LIAIIHAKKRERFFICFNNSFSSSCGCFEMRVARRLESFEYAIREIKAVASELERKGKRIYNFSIGDPPAYGFTTPEHIKAAIKKAISEDYNFYIDSLGDPELRELVAKKESQKAKSTFTSDDVLITSGVSEGIFFADAALVEPNDEILIPGPSYPPFSSYVKFFGGRPVEYALDSSQEWQPDPDEIRKLITNRTRAIVIISPNNPTGAMYSKKNLQAIINIAGEHDIPVISDEIYEKFVYEGSFISTASLSKDVPVIIFCGFSKTYRMTGLRLGYIAYHDQEGKLEEMKEAIKKMARIRLCANAPAQKGAIAALTGPQDHIDKMISELLVRRDYCCDLLEDIPQIQCHKSKGAFYLFPKIKYQGRWKNDKEFALDLLNKTGVLVVYGSGFGEHGKDHFRMVFLPPMDEIKAGLERLSSFFKQGK